MIGEMISDQRSRSMLREKLLFLQRDGERKSQSVLSQSVSKDPQIHIQSSPDQYSEPDTDQYEVS